MTVWVIVMESKSKYDEIHAGQNLLVLDGALFNKNQDKITTSACKHNNNTK